MKMLNKVALRGWTVALAGLVTVFSAGFARADPAPVSLHYTCPFQVIGDQPMTASVVWNASDTHVVGRATPRLPINTAATVGADVTGILRFVGATTVEGTADVHAVVAAPERDIPITMTLRVAKTAVPESGPLTVRASGIIPSLVFHRPGPARIVVGAIDLHLIPRHANGDDTLAGNVDSSCDLGNGQDGVLATFEVVPASPDPTDPRTPGAPGEPGRSGTPRAPQTSGGPGAARPSTSGPAAAAASAPAPESASAPAKVRGSSGSPGATASASRSGAPGAASSHDASPSGAPVAPDVADDASAPGGTHVSAPLRALAAFLAVSAASAGIGWWGWRMRRTGGRDERRD